MLTGLFGGLMQLVSPGPEGSMTHTHNAGNRERWRRYFASCHRLIDGHVCGFTRCHFIGRREGHELLSVSLAATCQGISISLGS